MMRTLPQVFYSATVLFFTILASGNSFANELVFEETVFFKAQAYEFGFDVDDTQKAAESEALFTAIQSLDAFLDKNPHTRIVDIEIKFDSFFADDGVHVIVIADVVVKMVYDPPSEQMPENVEEQPAQKSPPLKQTVPESKNEQA